MRVGRVAGVNRVAMAAGPDAAHTIVSIVDDGSGGALVTTAAPHGLNVDAVVQPAGTSVAGYSAVPMTLDDAPSTTTWISFGAYTANSTGGTWTLVTP